MDVGLRWEGRIENDISNFSYYEVEPMLTWRNSPRWNLAVGYERDERLRPTEEVMHVPNVNAVAMIPLKSWKITNRSRGEFVVPEMEERSWRFVYRNRTTLELPWFWLDRQWKPYLFDEWFLDADAADLTQNRVGIGIGVPLISHFMASLYWMRLDEKTDQGWQWHPVLGIQIESKF
jgi:hypothetical protein